MKTIISVFRLIGDGKTPLSILMVFLFLGCDNFVEVDLPPSQLNSSFVFNEEATATAAMTSVYAGMRDNGFFNGSLLGLSNQLGVYADEMDFYGDPSFSTYFSYTNGLLPTQTLVSTYWNAAYQHIYGANAVYEGVSNSTQLSNSFRQQLQGEALFVRGFIHFYLASIFGDVPYVTTTDYRQNSRVSRLPVAEVYAKAIDDLEQAVLLLGDDYIGSLRVRPNRSVAQAMLARVYLYSGRWAEASNAASAVLNASGIYSLENVTDVFLKTSMETLWQFPTALEGSATPEAGTFTLFTGPPNSMAYRPEYVSSFETGDLRKSAWMGEVTDGVNSWFYVSKYKQTESQSVSSEYSVVLRLAELYLIRAEARARQGELLSAADDLNVIRNRAGLLPTTATTQATLLTALLQERKTELFAEFGHRFFDLKRFGQLDAVLGGVKQGWNSTDALFPLPQSELSANPNLLPQNAGY